MYGGHGVLHYSHSVEKGYRLVVDIDPEIARLARYFISMAADIRLPRYPAHITVVRDEVPTVLEMWGVDDGDEVHFNYSPIVYNDKTYWWLIAHSAHLLSIRARLGLAPYSEKSRPPDGTDCFHITVGNTK